MAGSDQHYALPEESPRAIRCRWRRRREFQRAKSRVQGAGRNGDDVIALLGAVPRAYCDGGDGDDLLMRREFGDTLSGGAGKDTLYGAMATIAQRQRRERPALRRSGRRSALWLRRQRLPRRRRYRIGWRAERIGPMLGAGRTIALRRRRSCGGSALWRERKRHRRFGCDGRSEHIENHTGPASLHSRFATADERRCTQIENKRRARLSQICVHLRLSAVHC